MSDLSNRNIRYMEPKLFNTTAITPSHFVCGGAKKWLGVALGVVASIAAPFLAPQSCFRAFRVAVKRAVTAAQRNGKLLEQRVVISGASWRDW